jgi:hypothetical protein
MPIEVHFSGNTTVDGTDVWLAVTENRWDKFKGRYLRPSEYKYYAFIKAPGDSVKEIYGASAKELFASQVSQAVAGH